MASPASSPDPVEDTLCPICKEPMKTPVSVNCGHNFCKNCIGQHFVTRREMGEVEELLCPVCRDKIKEESIRPNWQLASLVENLHLQSQNLGKGYLCGTHKEKRLLFCQDDQELMCWVCEKTAKHKNHSVLPLEEAAPTYKDEIMSCLKILKEKKKDVLSYKADTEKESQGLLELLKMEKEKTVMTFRELHQFLEEQEKHVLTQMKEVMEEIERETEDHQGKLTEEAQSLENLIQEIEEKLLQPATDLLQDIKSFMERCEELKNSENSPIIVPVALKWRIWDFCDINPFLEGTTNQFLDSLLSGLQLQKVNVHLDPATAHPMLIVSEDYTSVRWIESRQDVPDTAERFDFWPFVLGCEEFTAGRHFWEVTVGSEGMWSVGVAKKSVARKGLIKRGPEGGIWSVGKGPYTNYSSTNLPHNLLSLNQEPKKIRVTLNCEGGRVAIFDADRGTVMCVFSGAPFTRQTLRPFCYLCGNAQLTFPS